MAFIKKYPYVIALLSILALTTCSKKEFQLQSGDLLFQQWDQSDFAKAINKVTEGYDGNDFAHVGLVLEYEGKLKVLEATTSRGVCLTDVDSFLYASVNQNKNPRIAVGRLKADYQPYVKNISDWSLNHLDKVYDTLFIYGNDKYYCSELLHDAFNMNVPEGKVFKLQPMTYKDPDTKSFFPIWVDYFEKINKPIPEGKPGINPGGMSKSEKLEIVYEYF